MKENILVDEEKVHAQGDVTVIAENRIRGVHRAGNGDMRSFLLGGFAFKGRDVGPVYDVGAFRVCRSDRAIGDETIV